MLIMPIAVSLCRISLHENLCIYTAGGSIETMPGVPPLISDCQEQAAPFVRTVLHQQGSFAVFQS